jgi:hypothetical protein
MTLTGLRLGKPAQIAKAPNAPLSGCDFGFDAAATETARCLPHAFAPLRISPMLCTGALSNSLGFADTPRPCTPSAFQRIAVQASSPASKQAYARAARTDMPDTRKKLPSHIREPAHNAGTPRPNPRGNFRMAATTGRPAAGSVISQILRQQAFAMAGDAGMATAIARGHARCDSRNCHPPPYRNSPEIAKACKIAKRSTDDVD